MERLAVSSRRQLLAAEWCVHPPLYLRTSPAYHQLPVQVHVHVYGT